MRQVDLPTQISILSPDAPGREGIRLPSKMGSWGSDSQGHRVTKCPPSTDHWVRASASFFAPSSETPG